MKRLLIISLTLVVTEFFACKHVPPDVVSNPCDTTKFTYAAIIKPILINHCTVCHSGNPPAGGYNFNTYDDAFKAAITNGRLYGAIAHLPTFIWMPEGTGLPLSSCEITQIKNWVNAGGPNN